LGLGAAFLIEWVAIELIEIALFQIGKLAVNRLRDVASFRNTSIHGGHPHESDDSRAPRRLRPVPNAYVVSATPGRIRLKVVGMRGNSAAAERITDSIRCLPGVAFVSASSVTGNVLVAHDPAAIDAQQIWQALEPRALSPQRLTTHRRPRASRLVVVGG